MLPGQFWVNKRHPRPSHQQDREIAVAACPSPTPTERHPCLNRAPQKGRNGLCVWFAANGQSPLGQNTKNLSRAKRVRLSTVSHFADREPRFNEETRCRPLRDQRDVREGRDLKARDPTWTAQQVFDHSRRNA